MQNLALGGMPARHLPQNIGHSPILCVEFDLFPSPLIPLLIFASMGLSSPLSKFFTVALGLSILQHLLICSSIPLLIFTLHFGQLSGVLSLLQGRTLCNDISCLFPGIFIGESATSVVVLAADMLSSIEVLSIFAVLLLCSAKELLWYTELGLHKLFMEFVRIVSGSSGLRRLGNRWDTTEGGGFGLFRVFLQASMCFSAEIGANLRKQ